MGEMIVENEKEKIGEKCKIRGGEVGSDVRRSEEKN